VYAKESRLDVCTATLRHIETSPMVSMNGIAVILLMGRGQWRTPMTSEDSSFTGDCIRVARVEYRTDSTD
jgi:hypothetical protein